MKLSTIEQALQAIKQGGMVIVADDESRENEGDLVCAAEKVTAETINLMTKIGRGVICLPMLDEDLQRLAIPMMDRRGVDTLTAAFTLSIEAANGISTGVSAHDRAHTIQVATDPSSRSQDIVMPGHVFPLRAQAKGVLQRAGHTEAAVDLARLAGLRPAGVICEVLKEDGSMARIEDLLALGANHQLPVITVKDLIAYRFKNEQIKEVCSAKLPIANHGQFIIKAFINPLDKQEHVALIADGDSHQQGQLPLVRVHSQCLTGDAFGSGRCDCGWQLQHALSEIAKQGGVLLYLHQEGRGIGLVNKIKAYALQDQGMDTVEANLHLGYGADDRDYHICAMMLKSMGIERVRLLTNNPNKVTGLEKCDIDVVERVAIKAPSHDNNAYYLATKKSKLGHLL